MNAPLHPAAGRHPADTVLAAFVDGRLSGDEHRRLVEHLAGCEDCREVVMETAKTLADPAVAAFLDDDGDGEEGGAEPAVGSGRVVVPKASRFRRTLPLIATLAAAAGVAALLIWTPAGRGFLGIDREVGVGELTASIAGSEAVRVFLTADGYQPGSLKWDVLMGESGEPALDLDPESTFRVGANVTFLDLTLRQGVRDEDAQQAARFLVGSIVNELTPADATEFSTAQLSFEQLRLELYEEVVDWPRLLAYNDRGDELLRGEGALSNPLWYDLGRWSAGALIASRDHDAEWFGERAVREQWRRLSKDGWPPPLDGAVEDVAEILRGGIEDGEWGALETAVSELVALGGNLDRKDSEEESEEEEDTSTARGDEPRRSSD